MMGVLRSTLRRATRSMWENFYFNAVSTSVIGAALLLMGMFITVLHNVNLIVDGWNRDAHISAYFSADTQHDRQKEIQREIDDNPNVATVVHVTPGIAQAWLMDQVEGLEDVLEELGPDALPASLEIELAESAAEPEEIAAFADSLSTYDFEAIDYGQEWIQRFNNFLGLVKLLGAVMGLLILLAALFVVTNTVYLVVYSRRDELETQKLVGATASYITIPFLIEGLFHGILGSLIAFLGLYAVHHFLISRLEDALQLGLTQEVAFLTPSWLLLLALAGIVLGVGAALVAVTRFLAQAP